MISAFLISQLRDSCDEESRLLTPPTPGIRNSEMKIKSWFDVPVSGFRRFAFHNFGTPVMKSLDS